MHASRQARGWGSLKMHFALACDLLRKYATWAGRWGGGPGLVVDELSQAPWRRPSHNTHHAALLCPCPLAALCPPTNARFIGYAVWQDEAEQHPFKALAGSMGKGAVVSLMGVNSSVNYAI